MYPEDTAKLEWTKGEKGIDDPPDPGSVPMAQCFRRHRSLSRDPVRSREKLARLVYSRLARLARLVAIPSHRSGVDANRRLAASGSSLSLLG